jgi:hypothetical protein
MILGEVMRMQPARMSVDGDREPRAHRVRVTKLRRGKRYRWDCICGRRSYTFRTTEKAAENGSAHERKLVLGNR